MSKLTIVPRPGCPMLVEVFAPGATTPTRQFYGLCRKGVPAVKRAEEYVKQAGKARRKS